MAGSAILRALARARKAKVTKDNPFLVGKHTDNVVFGRRRLEEIKQLTDEVQALKNAGKGGTPEALEKEARLDKLMKQAMIRGGGVAVGTAGAMGGVLHAATKDD